MDDILRLRIPASVAWDRERFPPGAPDDELQMYVIKAPPAAESTGRTLEIDLYDEIEVVWREGEEIYEANYALIGPFETEIINEAVELMADLLAEKVVLAWNSSFFSGGRSFVPVGELAEGSRRKYQWIRSWWGTYDWDRQR